MCVSFRLVFQKWNFWVRGSWLGLPNGFPEVLDLWTGLLALSGESWPFTKSWGGWEARSLSLCVFEFRAEPLKTCLLIIQGFSASHLPCLRTSVGFGESNLWFSSLKLANPLSVSFVSLLVQWRKYPWMFRGTGEWWRCLWGLTLKPCALEGYAVLLCGAPGPSLGDLEALCTWGLCRPAVQCSLGDSRQGALSWFPHSFFYALHLEKSLHIRWCPV